MYTHQVYDESQDAALDRILERLERRLANVEKVLARRIADETEAQP